MIINRRRSRAAMAGVGLVAFGLNWFVPGCTPSISDSDPDVEAGSGGETPEAGTGDHAGRAGFGGRSGGTGGHIQRAGSTGSGTDAGSAGEETGAGGASSSSAGESADGGASGSVSNGGASGSVSNGGASGSGPSGACVPTNPCHVGVLDAANGVTSCVDTLATLPLGTACGRGSVCSAAGVCELVACQVLPANLPNCVADKPCHIGHCSQAPICDDLTVIMNFGFAGNGTACGVPKLIGSCQEGECVVANCLPGGVACDISCVGPDKAALKEGSRCGSNLVCLQGKCTTELTITGSPFFYGVGTPFSGVVAQVTDKNLADTAATLTASVTWDGTTSIGTVSGSAGAFKVSASHTFATSGTYGVTVSVTDVLTGANVATTYGVSDHISEFTLPGTGLHPDSIALGKDGYVWFGLDNALGRISTSGGSFTTFPLGLPLSGTVAGLAAASDGNLWFTLDRDNEVGRITSAGALTFFPLPTANSQPGAITQGSDGNLWFLESGKIGRITPAGVLTEFPAGSPGFYGRQAVCVGPDQNIWFTEYIANKVGTISAGAITEYTLPTANSYPIAITAGPDGNLWLIEQGSGKVARVTTSGAITEFPINAAGQNADLATITSGPDGNLWVVHGNTNRISRVTPSGVVTRFEIPTPNSQSSGITSSATALWFAERQSGKIARFDP